MSIILQPVGFGGNQNREPERAEPKPEPKAAEASPSTGTPAQQGNAAAPKESDPVTPAAVAPKAALAREPARADPETLVIALAEPPLADPQAELARARDAAQAYTETARQEALLRNLAAPAETPQLLATTPTDSASVPTPLDPFEGPKATVQAA